MKSLSSTSLHGLFAAAVIAGACGGLDSGAINIVDGPGGGGDANNAGSTGLGGDTSNAGQAGGGGEGGGDQRRSPAVVSTTPSEGATDAEPLTTTIEIEFSENLDESTVTSDSVQILDGTTPVAGALSFAGTTATFTPDERLDLITTYTISVSTDVKDLGGTPMTEAYSGSFTVRDGFWSSEVATLSRNNGFISYDEPPPPVIDARGNALFVWAQTASDDDTTLFSIWGREYTPGLGWGTSFEIDGSETDVCLVPAVTMAPNGDVLVSWTQIVAGQEEVFASRRVDGAWDTPKRVDSANAGANQLHSSVAIAPNGDFHVSYSYYDGTTYYYLYGNNATHEGDWQASATYMGGYVDNIAPAAMSFDASGNGIAVYPESYGSTYTANYSRYLKSDGYWTYVDEIPGATGSAAPYVSYYLPMSIARDEKGGVMTVWVAGNGMYASRFTKASGWSTAKELDAIDDTPNSPRLGYAAGQFAASWVQQVDAIYNVYLVNFADGAWSEAALASSGDDSTDTVGYVGFGLDRHGNALLAWRYGAYYQVDNELWFGRQLRSTGEITAASLNVTGEYNRLAAAVAANGISVLTFTEGYGFGSPEAIRGLAFE